MPEVGAIIAGKYRVGRAIGAGGMGTVVAATHLQLGTQLALKFLADKIKDSRSSVERFTREARACAQLRGEHVCRVSDFGVEDGLPYIAMELLDGSDLATVCRRGLVDPTTAADYVLQACIGLAEAHALGIVHRDLKPGNLFLSRRPDGSPLIKVLDFGIAKIPVGDDQSLTQTSHVVGSPGYMAPEQLRSSKTVDMRADIWALGVILYELVSGRHPFQAEAVTETALKIAMDEPPPLVEAPALQAVVSHCLAKDPAQRFADVGALATALAPFAPDGRASAAIVGRVLAESAETRRTTPHVPAVEPAPSKETVRDSPRPLRQADSTHQAGAGVIEAKPVRGRRRIAIVAGIGMFGLASAGAFYAIRQAGDGGPSPGDAPPIAATGAPPPADAAVVVPAAPDAALKLYPLTLAISNAADATISVDDVVWGEGRRITRDVTDGIHQIKITAPGYLVLLAKATVGGRAETMSLMLKRDPYTKQPIRDGDPIGSSGPDINFLGSVSVADRDTIARGLASVAATMTSKGLLAGDLGDARTDDALIKQAVVAGDGAAAQRLLGHLRSTVDAIKIDRSFVIAKVSRLQVEVRQSTLDEAASRQMTATLQEIMQLFGDGNFASANRRVNMAFASLTPAAPKRAAPVPNPDGKNPSSPRDPSKPPSADKTDIDRLKPKGFGN